MAMGLEKTLVGTTHASNSTCSSVKVYYHLTRHVLKVSCMHTLFDFLFSFPSRCLRPGLALDAAEPLAASFSPDSCFRSHLRRLITHRFLSSGPPDLSFHIDALGHPSLVVPLASLLF